MNLPEKVNTAVIERKNLSTEVLPILNPIEREILVSSAKKSISDYPLEELTSHVGKLSAMIAKDAGIKQVDAYSATRFVDILRKYYYSLSLSEVKIAFELGLTGQLDDYLPKDKNGHPDSNHYQSFSIEYISKILNAYRSKLNDVKAKAYTSLPASKKEVTDKEKKYYRSKFIESLRENFIYYKYKGVMKPRSNDMLVYKYLERLGIAEPIRVVPSDKQSAVNRLINKHQNKVINDFVGSCIRTLGIKHGLVPDEAYIIAQERAIKETYDYMIKNEINI